MDEKKFAEELTEKVNGLLQKAKDGLISKEQYEKEIKELKDEIKSLKDNDNVAKLQGQLDGLTVKLKEVELSKKEAPKTFIQLIKEAITPDVIKKIHNNEKVSLEIKSPATMTISGAITGDVARQEAIPGFVWLPESQPMLQNIIPQIPTNANSVTITEAYGEQGAAAFHLEGDAGGQMSWSWREKIFQVKDVSVWAKFSRNIMDDVDNFIGQVQNKLLLRLDKKIDQKLMFGDEGTYPEEFDGLTHIATAFNNNGVKTYKPTERDVIVAAIAQLEEADFVADFVAINPRDKFKLKIAKAGKDNAVLQFQDFPQTLEGLRVITSSRMTAGKFLVGDSTKAVQHIRNPFEITIGNQDADNLTKRLLTVVITKRLAFEISANNYGAFVYGDFATAKTAMTLTT